MPNSKFACSSTERDKGARVCSGCVQGGGLLGGLIFSYKQLAVDVQGAVDQPSEKSNTILVDDTNTAQNKDTT